MHEPQCFESNTLICAQRSLDLWSLIPGRIRGRKHLVIVSSATHAEVGLLGPCRHPITTVFTMVGHCEANTIPLEMQQPICIRFIG